MSYDDDRAARLPLAEGRAELLEEIMAQPQTESRRAHARWIAPLAAAAAVAAVVGGIALVSRGGSPTRGSDPAAGGGAVCWDGSTGATCPAPTGRAALPWVFPRLAGHLDRCVDALAAESDDPPMPFGTPAPGGPSGGVPTADRPAAYRCDLGMLGLDASAAAPRVWVYALGSDGGSATPGESHLSALVQRFGTGTFSIGGETAGPLVMDEVGLIHPSHLFIAKYADYPFAVMGYADDKAEAEQIIAALGARKPSEMTAPGVPDPSLPDFPSQALRSPEPTPS
ncbi:hypothetical protein [Nocardioides ultimimeridianus]